MKYDQTDILKFFEDHAIGPWKLGRMVGVPGEVVKAYLIDGSEIESLKAERIDTAIRMIDFRETEPKKPKSTEQDIQWLRSELKRKQEELEREKTEQAMEEIMTALLIDPGEFYMCADPLCEVGALQKYGTDEFLRRFRRKVLVYEM